MNARVTIGLLIALVVVGVAVYWSESRPEASPTPTPVVSRGKLFEFSSKDASALAVVWAGKQVAIQKQNGQWQLGGTDAAPADGATVDAVLARLGAVESNRDLAPKPEDLGSFGLDAPQGTITVTLASGASRQLLVGSATPDKSGYYTRRVIGTPDTTVRIAPLDAIEPFKQFVAQPPKAKPTPAPTSTPAG